MLPQDEAPWEWRRHVSDIDGAVKWYGEHPYRSAEVMLYGTGWQARMSNGQRSGYYRSPGSAKAWAERYGKPRARRRRAWA